MKTLLGTAAQADLSRRSLLLGSAAILTATAVASPLGVLARSSTPPTAAPHHLFMDRLQPGVDSNAPTYAPPQAPAWAAAHASISEADLLATRYIW